MKTTISFIAEKGYFSFSSFFTLRNPTAEQIERLDELTIHRSGGVVVSIPPALTILLGISPTHQVIVPGSKTLNNYCSIFDPGTGSKLEIRIDKGAIIENWLANGAPAEWHGMAPASTVAGAKNRAKLARDASGRFCRV